MLRIAKRYTLSAVDYVYIIFSFYSPYSFIFIHIKRPNKLVTYKDVSTRYHLVCNNLFSQSLPL